MRIFYHTGQVDATDEVVNVDDLWIKFVIVGFGCGVDYHVRKKSPTGFSVQ